MTIIPLKPFFVVWNPAHGQSRQMHETYLSAHNEAKRLALANRGQSFHVLAPISVALTTEPISVSEYEPLRTMEAYLDDELPF